MYIILYNLTLQHHLKSHDNSSFVFVSPGSVVAALGIESPANVQSDLTETLMRFTGTNNMIIAPESTVVTASPSTTVGMLLAHNVLAR